jgi:hypothetical protein
LNALRAFGVNTSEKKLPLGWVNRSHFAPLFSFFFSCVCAPTSLTPVKKKGLGFGLRSGRSFVFFFRSAFLRHYERKKNPIAPSVTAGLRPRAVASEKKLIRSYVASFRFFPCFRVRGAPSYLLRPWCAHVGSGVTAAGPPTPSLLRRSVASVVYLALRGKNQSLPLD